MAKVTINDITELATLRGLTVLEQKAFYKVARLGKAMYFSRTKSGVVSRCDISGYEVEHEAIVPPKKKNGKVTGQVLFEHDAAIDALDLAFEELCSDAKGTKVEPTAQ